MTVPAKSNPDWSISVNIDAVVHWREPAKDRAEEIMRKQAEMQVRYAASKFEKELAAILESDIRAMKP